MPRFRLPKAIAHRAKHTPGQMNSLEFDYASTLMLGMSTGHILHYQFEPIKLRLGKNWKTTYTPDFLVVTQTGHIELHEVKGHWEDDARVKIKVAAEKYPQFKFIAITRKSKNAPWDTEEF